MSSGRANRIARAFRWAALAAVIGIVAGFGAVLLSALANGADALHARYPLTLWLLPVFALASAWLYRRLDMPFDIGTLSVIKAQQSGARVPVRLACAIPLGTALTLLGGGSVGKEAAALQMGGAIASGLSDMAEEGEDARSTFLLCGMAAAFSALMFAPVAATLFVLEVSRMKPSRLLSPKTLCVLLSSAVAYSVARFFNVGRLWSFDIAVPPVQNVLLEVLTLSVLCAFAGLAFVLLLKTARTVAVSFLGNPYLRVLVGSGIVIALTVACGSSDFSGTGAALIEQALAGDSVFGWTFAWKMALTVVCLGFGLKGGEIMPVFCIGACLGSAFGFVTGTPYACMAAVGLVGLFAACARCPLAAFAIGVEAFGWSGAPCFAVAAVVAMLAAHAGNLYDGFSWTLDVPWAHRDDDGASERAQERS
jgi:H+/Cl- antiporter ClcA